MFIFVESLLIGKGMFKIAIIFYDLLKAGITRVGSFFKMMHQYT